MMNTACAARTSTAPDTQVQAGRLSATRASTQIVPRIDQLTVPAAALARRSRPTTATAATAPAIAIMACLPVRPPERERAGPPTPGTERRGDGNCRDARAPGRAA